MTYPCPKDPTHLSDDPDYCSVCGAKIAGSPPVPAAGGVGAPLAAPSDPALAQACPDCGTPRAGAARFCEVCRHDFVTGEVGGPAPAPPPAPARRDLTPAPDPAPASLSAPALEVVAVADRALYIDPDPSLPFPDGEPTRTFPLDLAENLIGRRSDTRDIHPEVPLTDTGVSHRHAKLLREPDGSFTLLDVGSSNGTSLNGQAVPAGVRTPVRAGDEITLGCWTRLTLREAGGRP